MDEDPDEVGFVEAELVEVVFAFVEETVTTGFFVAAEDVVVVGVEVEVGETGVVALVATDEGFEGDPNLLTPLSWTRPFRRFSSMSVNKLKTLTRERALPLLLYHKIRRVSSNDDFSLFV